MTTMFEIVYDDNLYPYERIDKDLLSFLDTLLRSKKNFQLIANKSSDKLIKELQELCKTLNIKLDISENSQPEAVAEIIKVLGGAAIGGVQGGVYGFVFAAALEGLKEKMGGEKALEIFLEGIIGFDIFIPGMKQIMLAVAIVNALISGAVTHLTLTEVRVKVHFQKSYKTDYKGLVFDFN